MNKLETFKRRFNKAKATQDLWMALFEAAYHYCIPNRNLYWWTSQTQGAQKNARVYDTTGVSATRSFVAKVQSALTPPQQTWATLEAGTDIEEEDRERVNLYLQKTNDTIFNYIRQSNFDLAINECYYDLAVGTAALIVNEGTDDKPLFFRSVPLARIAVEESDQGLLDSCYRWWDEIRISDIQSLWPKARITTTMQSLLAVDPTATVKNLVEGCIYTPGKPYTYALWSQDELLLEEEQECSPWIVFRWNKVNNETMGRGPVIDALPALLSLNEVARLELASANLNICKPFMAYSDGVFNPWTFKLEPNTIIPVAPNSAGQFPLQPLPDVANPAFAQLQANELRQQINKLMYADPIGPVDAPTRTATEIAVRQRNLAEEIGPLFTRLQQEFLSRLIQRVVYILQKKGLIGRLSVNGKEIAVRYKSPLVIAQGQQDVQTFTQYFQLLQGIVGPEAAIININPVKTPMWLADKLGVDKTILNSAEELQQFYKEQSAKQEMQSLMAQGGAIGQQPLPQARRPV